MLSHPALSHLVVSLLNQQISVLHDSASLEMAVVDLLEFAAVGVAASVVVEMGSSEPGSSVIVDV